MQYAPISREWDTLLALLDQWEEMATEALEHYWKAFVTVDRDTFLVNGYNPPLAFHHAGRKIYGLCSKLAPDVDRAAFGELITEFGMPGKRDIKTTLWPKVQKMLERLRYFGQTTEAAEPKPKSKPPKAGDSIRGSRGKTGDLILSGLNLHHGYDGTSILSSDPIGVNELAEQISKQRAKDGQKPIRGATVSKWFGRKFGGHDKYRIECASGNLSRSLKLLNGDFTPRMVSQAVAESAE